MTSGRSFSNYLQHVFSDSSEDEQTLISSIGYESSKESISIVQKREKCENRNSASTFDKFCLLMWKNFLLQYRHKKQTIFQIFVPMLFTLNLLTIRVLIKPDITEQNTFFHSFNITTPNQFVGYNMTRFTLVYSPENDVLKNLLNGVEEDLSAASNLNWTVHGAPNSSDVEKSLESHTFMAGVVFNDSLTNITELPKNLDYALRFPSELRTNYTNDSIIFSWQTDMRYPQYSGGGPRANYTDEGGAPNYFFENFLAIQHFIALNFIKQLKNDSDELNPLYIPTIQMQRFPYPPYTKDDLLDGLDRAIGLFIMLSFVYPVICTVRFIAVEKEKQLKEIMKIMGMPVWLHWASWFVRTMFFLLISNTLVIGILKIPIYQIEDKLIAIFTKSDFFSMWLFLLAYSVSMTAYCFLLSVLFSKANTAAAVSGLIWFVSHMPFVFLTINNIKVPSWVEKLACISPNVAMSYGFKTIAEYEKDNCGWKWGKPSEIPQTTENGFLISVEITTYFMLATASVFLVIALYIEKVFPGEYGVPHKWNFFCKSDFWLGDDGYTIKDLPNVQETNENFESEPLNCETGVRVKNLRKIFSNGKVACRDVTFNMYRDQIMVLLGHNGAGKSTTIKMLTGLIPPTSGTAIINGYDIRTDLRRARESIGICPQHDILFDELTVREHIEFYCRLKGLNKIAVHEEVKKYVQLLNLESKIDTPSYALSGGMQRKLSFIIALCGDSKVVLCDEPTSGVDPKARRELWDLIQGEKFGRTIILTTHFMDEADVLGDRIAIMADGEVKCCGSPFFLKHRFGSGYRLICVKSMWCDSNEVTAVLREFIPEVELMDETLEELSYTLPYEHSSKFPKMFERLEHDLDQLKIVHFGVSSTELEEVFLKVGSDHKKLNEEELELNEEANYTGVPEKELLSGFRLRMNHWYAMLKKRYYCWKNSWILFFVQIAVLIFFTAISVTFARLSKNSDRLPKLELSFNSYDGTHVTILETPQMNTTEIGSIVTLYGNGFDASNKLVECENITKYFLNIGNSIKIRTNTTYLAGLSVNTNVKNTSDSIFVAWFNDQLFHTAPLSLNLLHNAILKSVHGADYNISVHNWPIPFRPESEVILTMNGDDLGSQLAMYISFAMAFIIALYIMFHIRERASKAKLLQFISGVDASTFWVTSFLFDFVVYGLVSTVFYLTIFAFQEKYWSTTEQLMPLIPIFGLFGLSSLAITYVASGLFSNASYGFVILATAFVFTGTTFFKLITILLSPLFNQGEIANYLKRVFLLFPHYAMGESLYNLNKFRICEKVCSKEDTSIYDWNEPGIGRNLTYMALTAVIFCIVLWIIEYRIISKIVRFFRRPSQLPAFTLESNAIDNDVIHEKNKVNAMSSDDLQNHNLVLHNLTKSYGNFLAVKGISVAVKMGECFGLLGVNGAGKTTTFKMITGDTSISKGDAFINGISLKRQLAEVQKLIGYCPQFDALLDNLTGTQTLEIFGLLRGYRRKDISAMSARLAESLNFTKHIDKEIKSYSGGNKRKLSTAIALMGNPAVAYLDEPSSGMDPGAKRSLWSTVLETRKSGTSIVLTSHSMEECEALCTRIAIMVNGEFKCLGSAQHLKNQFSNGFLLTMKIRSNGTGNPINQLDVETTQRDLIRIIYKSYPLAVLKEQYQGLITFYVPQTSQLKWSALFDHMETIEEFMGIEDYSISQTTLEQVFLSFTKPIDKECQNEFN